MNHEVDAAAGAGDNSMSRAHRKSFFGLWLLALSVPLSDFMALTKIPMVFNARLVGLLGLEPRTPAL
jgi:hypothetical protein